MKNENSFNFIITLNGLTDGASTIIPILVTGSWTKGGREIDFTKADLDQAIANFQKLANHDLNMDYDHACEDLERAAGEPTPSAGRITNLGPVERFTIPSGPRKGEEVWMLKGSYEPTERARELIRNREYRYVSAAFVKDYPDRTSGDSQGLTLTSVALTNQPFLDELPEIWLSVESPKSEVRSPKTEPTRLSAEKGGSMGLTLKHSFAADGSHVHEAVGEDGKSVGTIPHDQMCKYSAELSKAGHFSAEASAILNTQFMSSFAKEVGAEGRAIEEIRGLVTLGREPLKPEVTQLCETIGADGKLDNSKLDVLDDSGKISRSGWRRAKDAETRVLSALNSGKLTPAMIATGAPLRLALSDGPAFKALIEDRQAVVKVNTVTGIGGTGSETGESPRQLFARLVEEKKRQLMSADVRLGELEAHRKAGALVAKENPDLLKNYGADKN